MPLRVSVVPTALFRRSVTPYQSRELVTKSRIPSLHSFSTTSLNMAPPKAALDFVDFVNDSPTRRFILLHSELEVWGVAGGQIGC